MVSVDKLVYLCAFFGLTLAAPTPEPGAVNFSTEERTFSVKQVDAGRYKKYGSKAVIRAYRKFNIPLPDHLAKINWRHSIQRTHLSGNGSEPALPGDDMDSLYLSPVKAGGADLKLDFDTGSADLWAFSSLQSNPGKHTVYDPKKSTTAKQLSGASWEIQYGDGSTASGKVFLDKVTVGGVTATQQAVEAAEQVSKQFEQLPGDGLLGLASSKINTVKPQQQKTFFDTVSSQLEAPLFSVDLRYHAAGSYDFGFIDKSKYKGEITYTKVDSSQGFWGFSADGYAVGSETAKKAAKPISGIADTGTTLMLLDSAIAKDYYSKVDGAKEDQQLGGYVYDCKTALPDFTVTIEGKPHTIPGKYMNYGKADPQSTQCFGGLQGNDGLQGLSIFGDIFLKSQYVIHDAGKGQIGFAQQA